MEKSNRRREKYMARKIAENDLRSCVVGNKHLKGFEKLLAQQSLDFEMGYFS